MTLSPNQRIAGVLAPVFALRGKNDLGVGDTAALTEFIDWAADIGFRLVKILPINETGGDHSPYNAISSVALELTTIDVSPAALPDVRRKEYEFVAEKCGKPENPEVVDYPRVKTLKRRLLEAGFERFHRLHLQRDTPRAAEFARFAESQSAWIEDYALFRALMEENGNSECWDRWPEEHRTLAAARAWAAALRPRKAKLFEKRRRFFTYVQWIAFEQWRRVKAHAESKGVALMGDIPFGVSYYSADVWSRPEIFRTGWCGGTPPDKIFKHDAFVSKWGQNWGIPLYDWDALRRDNFSWWRQRVRGVREFFHLFRIDHVLGFYRIYGFPWRPERNAEFLPLSEDEARERTGGPLPHFEPHSDDTSEHKDGNRRDGEEYLRVVVEEAGEGRVIGEDLGEVPDYVRPNLTSLGIAGYKIPAWEKRDNGSLIPGPDYQRLSLVTYGTHDHEPLKATWERLAQEISEGSGHAEYERRILAEYAAAPAPANSSGEFTPELHDALLRALFRSNSWIAVVMITDLFGRSERFNYPGVAAGAWTQRVHATVEELARDLRVSHWREMLQESGRAGGEQAALSA
jgi:4-alpha-glucanotransferase